MSIEDVDYMKQNSIKENYTFIIDSKFRNQDEHPNPNNYVVNFDIPFKNVFGIEILDVSIPKTMYNIDKDSNILKLYINTTKSPIINYNDMVEGLVWKKFDTIKDSEIDTEIVNYILSDALKNNTTIENLRTYNITNLNKNNYIRVPNISEWKKISPSPNLNNIDNSNEKNVNYISIYNPILSEDLKNNALDNQKDYDINNIRTYNIIPIIDNTSSNYYLTWYNSGNSLIDNNYGLKWEYIGTTIPKNGNLIEKNFLTNDKLELSLEELESLNIDLSNKNNYTQILNGYYKPKTNINIGTKWKNIDGELNNYTEYKNTILANEIKNKIYIGKEITFSNKQLNDNEYDFNNNVNIFIKIITGLRWRITNTLSNLVRINNPDIIEAISKNASNIVDRIDLNITHFANPKLILNNIKANSYVLVGNTYWKPDYTYYIPDSSEMINNSEKNLWIINNSFINLIESQLNYENKYNEIVIDENTWNSFNIDKEKLLAETFILVNNQYYKIKPSYYYTPKIEYYYAIDILNINNVDDYEKMLNLFFELFTIEIPIGNYTLNKLIISLNTKFRENINQVILNRTIENVNNNNSLLINSDNYDLELTCTGNTIPADIQNILKFESNRHIIFDMNNSTLNKTLGFYSKVNESSEYLYNYTYLNINKIINYEKFYHSINLESTNKYTIIAPGIVYLIGSEYIILKCPEIEEHLYGSLSYTKNTIGLAKIRVSNWGLNEESTSYLKLKLREFHPIGKLSKITLRFENANGVLYDFRGVNHNIVFAIHYYSAKQKQNFEKSIINPEYKMNYLDYKYSQEEFEEDSDIENEENHSRVTIEDYKKMEKIYSDKKFDNGHELDYNEIIKNIYHE